MKKPAADTRQHILDVAMSLMTQKGYTAVGLAEVVSAADVPKGSFYYYFKSKEEFGLALLGDYFSAYLSQVDALLDVQGTGAQKLMGYFQYWSETQGTEVPDGKCLVVKLGPEVCDLSEDMRSVLDRGTAAIIAKIARCVQLGREDGSITNDAPPQELAESLYELWLGASLLSKLGKNTTPFDRALLTTSRLLS